MKQFTALAIAVLLSSATAFGDTAPVAFPEGYRGWSHVKSMVIEPGHPLYEAFGGIHHIYANELALQGFSDGRFPQGAIFVFDLLEAIDGDAAITEGSRKVVGVMERDPFRFPATGGWGFEGFAGGNPETRLVGDQAETACFACHTARTAQDFVFTEPRD